MFLAILSLVFGHENIPRRVIWGVGALGIVLALVFVVANSFAIGGSERIFHVGRSTVYDGRGLKTLIWPDWRSCRSCSSFVSWIPSSWFLWSSSFGTP